MKNISYNRRYELCTYFYDVFHCNNCVCFVAQEQGRCSNFCAFMQKFHSGISEQNKRYVYAAGNKKDFSIKIRIRDKLTRSNLTEYLPDSRIIDIQKEAKSAFNIATAEFSSLQDSR